MKKLFTLLFVLSLSLIARENPFEATNAYEEEAARLIEINETEEDYDVEFQQEQQYINEMYEKMSKPETVEKVEKKEEKPKKPTLTEEKVKQMIEKAKKEVKPKTIVKEVIIEKEKPQEIVYVKPRLDITTEKQLLPFVKIEFDNDKIDIYSKYKITKKITLPGKNKIILDYNAKENFYTVREKLNSTSFPSIAIGNHKEDKFFRIVIDLAEVPENYEINFNDDMVTIVKLYE